MEMTFKMFIIFVLCKFIHSTSIFIFVNGRPPWIPPVSWQTAKHLLYCKIFLELFCLNHLCWNFSNFSLNLVSKEWNVRHEWGDVFNLLESGTEIHEIFDCRVYSDVWPRKTSNWLQMRLAVCFSKRYLPLPPTWSCTRTFFWRWVLS